GRVVHLLPGGVDDPGVLAAEQDAERRLAAVVAPSGLVHVGVAVLLLLGATARLAPLGGLAEPLARARAGLLGLGPADVGLGNDVGLADGADDVVLDRGEGRERMLV